MDPAVMQVITVAFAELVMVPVMVWVLRRILGKKLDEFDDKREQARKEQKARERSQLVWEQSVTLSLQTMLRSELISEYRKAKSKSYASLETKEYVEKVHDAYREMGGNHLGTTMFEYVIGLPSDPPTNAKEHQEYQEH